MFPGGGPGVGLVLLRISVGAGFLLDESLRGGDAFAYGGLTLRVALCAGLCTGALTPLFAVSGFLLAIVDLSHLGIANAPLTIVTMIDALALALLGPGAYSLDARLFGRRVVVLPPRNPGDG